MHKLSRTTITALACAALIYPALALAKTVQVSGDVKGDKQYPTGRVFLDIKVDGKGKPTKITRGGFANIDTVCDQGGATVNAQGQKLGPTKIKKQGKKFTFKWEGDSPPVSTASIKGTVKKNAKKATGTIDVVYDVDSTTGGQFLCRANNVEFTLTPGG